MIAVEIAGDRLLSLFAMSQELAPFGIDVHTRWQQHCAYLDAAPVTTSTPLKLSPAHADLAALARRPVIFLTLHFDAAFAEGIAMIAEQLRRLGRTQPQTAIVGGRSTDAAYDGYRQQSQPGSGGLPDLDYVGIADPGFTGRVMGTLRKRGVLFALVDANQGSSEVIDVPFLYHRLNLRSGLFRLAHASRAIVQPFMVDSTRGAIFFGPALDARELPIRRTAEETGRFLGQHVLLDPIRWLHWQHCIALSTQNYTHRSATSGRHGRVPDWYLAHPAHGHGRLAFNTATSRLYQLDAATYEQMRAGDPGPGR
ncbi:MAG TPA: hypothetical protein VHO01_04570 [Jatrophihabitans sp.]|nr:hypothetical protein [Jatrophihabitans sp.]